jgi:hypothetical protein
MVQQKTRRISDLKDEIKVTCLGLTRQFTVSIPASKTSQAIPTISLKSRSLDAIYCSSKVGGLCDFSSNVVILSATKSMATLDFFFEKCATADGVLTSP